MNDHHEAHRLPTDTDDGLLLIISGPSGVGKTTITRGVDRQLEGSVFSVSVTTRPKSATEVDGVDYRFVTRDEFDAMREAGEFLETAQVYGNAYGTPRAWVIEQLRRGRVVILEIDTQGAAQVKAALPQDTFAIFIMPPSEAVLLDRLHDRRREPEAIIQRRFAEAQREIAAARTSGVYDAFIVNDDLNHAIAEAIRLVEDRRRRRPS